jgi:N-acetylmuramic acid 6-phosphate etherase
MLRTSELPHPAAIGLDLLSIHDAVALFLEGHAHAIEAVCAALPRIADAATLIAGTLSAGGKLAYAGAGSSALMAMADGMELAGTFGIPPEQVRLHMAGGLPGLQDAGMPGGTEDDTVEAAKAASDLGPGDLAILVSASGSTPYALAFRDAALARGARVIAVANNAGSPLFDGADVAVCLPTGPEVIAGSTRLSAGTAQKVALNLMTSQAGVIMGHVHDGLMVNLRPDNIKLQERAARIVASLADCDATTANGALQAAGSHVKTAVLMAKGASADTARHLLAAHEGRLRGALMAMASGGPDKQAIN